VHRPNTAARSTRTDAVDAPTLDALRRYGDHAKAAYVLFEKQANALEGDTLYDVVKKLQLVDVGTLDGLKGYQWLDKIMGYPGTDGVFTVPIPINDAGLLGIAAVEPSCMGYIAERTGADGVKEIVIAFRGSSVKADWETNLLGGVATGDLYGKGKGLVHRGFYNLVHMTPDGAQDVNPAKIIRAVLAPYKNTPVEQLPKVITTGHSLGGALAIIAAVYIANMIPGYRSDNPDYTQHKLQTYTFAAPRIGDEKLSSYLANDLKYKAVQVKNKPDVVPFVPPKGLWDLPNTLWKLIGMAGKAEPTSGDLAPAAVTDKAAVPEDATPTDMERWLVYQELLAVCTDPDLDRQVTQLQEYLDGLNAQYEAAPADLVPAATQNLIQKIMYSSQLLTTVLTKWEDNPVPGCIYLMDVSKSGQWGGKNHSLQVYLGNLDTLQKT